MVSTQDKKEDIRAKGLYFNKGGLSGHTSLSSNELVGVKYITFAHLTYISDKHPFKKSSASNKFVL